MKFLNISICSFATRKITLLLPPKPSITIKKAVKRSSTMLAVTVRHGFVRAWTMIEASRRPLPDFMELRNGATYSSWQNSMKHQTLSHWSTENWESNMFLLMISSIVSSGICSQNLDEVWSNRNLPSNQNTDLHHAVVLMLCNSPSKASWTPIFQQKKEAVWVESSPFPPTLAQKWD